MMDHIRDMSREELLRLVEVYAKNWLAHDGCWFLAAEESHGMETAMDLDTRSWKRFARAEARRIAEAFNLPEHGGLEALESAFRYRLYAAINRQETERVDPHTLRFRMLECRVQQARRRKGLPDFPCKSVGIVEFTQFARAIDPRIETRCIACPPDEASEFVCGWEFTIAE
ncbi:MAG: DUF6125 family protein [Candidatus Eiseniibacteriota bacterium]|jgi:hypothetical protein